MKRDLLAALSLLALFGCSAHDPQVVPESECAVHSPAAAPPSSDPMLDVSFGASGTAKAAGLSSTPSAATRANADGTLQMAFGKNLYTFSSTGTLQSQVVGTTAATDYGPAAIQNDGKWVTTGGARVARFDATGNPDGTFGTAGVATLSLTGTLVPSRVALAPNGDVVVVGLVVTGNQDPDSVVYDRLYLARLRSDGAPVASFGTSGVVTVIVNASGAALAPRVAVQPDGKIIVAGTPYQGDVKYSAGGTRVSGVALARFNTDGTPDLSFGNSGEVQLNFAEGSSDAKAIAIDASGNLLVAGEFQRYCKPGPDFLLLRLDANGKIDTSFGVGGTVLSDFGGSETVSQIAVETSGRIVVTGSTEPLDASGYSGAALEAYTSRGIADYTFGDRGRRLIKGASPIDAFAVQADGKIVTFATDALTSSLEMLRLLP